METVQSKNEIQLDVRPVEPKNRFDTIIGTWKKMDIGDTMYLTLDHDPQCMYYTLLEDYGKDSFEFHYIEKGPVDWKVKVIKCQ